MSVCISERQPVLGCLETAIAEGASLRRRGRLREPIDLPELEFPIGVYGRFVGFCHDELHLRTIAEWGRVPGGFDEQTSDPPSLHVRMDDEMRQEGKRLVQRDNDAPTLRPPSSTTNDASRRKGPYAPSMVFSTSAIASDLVSPSSCTVPR